MRIHITGRHVSVTDEIREHVENKAGKLLRFYDRIHEIEVIFDHESEQFKVDMIVRTDHKHTFISQEAGPDPAALIDLVVEKAGRQLVKHKEKQRNHKHDGKSDLGQG